MTSSILFPNQAGLDGIKKIIFYGLYSFQGKKFNYFQISLGKFFGPYNEKMRFLKPPKTSLLGCSDKVTFGRTSVVMNMTRGQMCFRHSAYGEENTS